MARRPRIDLDGFHHIINRYSQETVRYLELSTAMVSKIFRGVKYWVGT